MRKPVSRQVDCSPTTFLFGKSICKGFSMLPALCMALSIGAFAGSEPSGETSAAVGEASQQQL